MTQASGSEGWTRGSISILRRRGVFTLDIDEIDRVTVFLLFLHQQHLLKENLYDMAQICNCVFTGF